MSDNPFASYNIEIPRKYAEELKRYCQTAGQGVSLEFAPFKRQVDFWYYSFLYAVTQELEAKPETDASNITPASILSGDSYRITHIQLAYLGYKKDVAALADHRRVFDYALSMANAGIPYVLQSIKAPGDKPLWELLESVEETLKLSPDSSSL